MFGTAATSLKEYIPLHGVARMDTLIGGDEGESAGEGKGVAEPAVRSMTRRTNCETSIVRSSAAWRERPASIIANSMQNSSSEPADGSIRQPCRNWSAVLRCLKSGEIPVLTAGGHGLARIHG